MFSLERIQTFVRIVEANSYVAVAQQVKLSKAAISKQISLLEQEIGIKLLERTTRRLKLTEAGVLYYTQCKRLLELVHEMEVLTSSIRKEPSGMLTIFCGRYFGEQLVVPHLKEFLEKYPKLKVRLRLEERVPDIIKEEIDIVIGLSIPGPLEAIQRKIQQTRYVFCASPDYLERFGTPLNPKDLLKHRYLTHSMRKPDHILNFGDHELNVDPYMHINDAQALLTCALHGLGVVRLHDYMVQDSLKAGTLIEILSAFNQDEYPIYLYYMQNNYLSPKVRYFIDFIFTKLS